MWAASGRHGGPAEPTTESKTKASPGGESAERESSDELKIWCADMYMTGGYGQMRRVSRTTEGAVPSTHVAIQSPAFEVQAEVQATGPADEVNQWTAGVIQTVRRSKRVGWYKNAQNQQARRFIDQTPANCRDAGATAPAPWYNHDQVKLSPNQPATFGLGDAPFSGFSWAGPQTGEWLYKTTGHDSFVTWTIARRSDGKVKRLKSLVWRVSHNMTVTRDHQVNITGESTGSHEGTPGGPAPQLGGAPANKRSRQRWSPRA